VIFKYFKVYTINGLLLCFILEFCFYPRAIRYFGFSSFSLLSGIYRCKIMQFCYSFATFSTCIDICILLERISLFNKKYRKYLRIFSEKPYLILLVCSIFSVIINIPIILTSDIRSESEFKEAILNDTKDKTFTYCSRSNFSLSTFGKVLIFFVSFIRDFVFLLIEIILTFVSLYYLRKFFNRKTIILHSSSNQIKSTEINHYTKSNKSIEKIIFEKELPSTLSLNEICSNSNQAEIDGRICTKSNTTKNCSKKLQVMSLSFAAASILVNISCLANLFAFVFDMFGFSFIITTFNVVFIAILKYFLTFFLFFIFNKSFRNYVVNILKKSK